MDGDAGDFAQAREQPPVLGLALPDGRLVDRAGPCGAEGPVDAQARVAIDVNEPSFPWWDISAICTFSRTVIEAKVAVIWKVRPTPRRQTARGLSPTMSRPPRRTMPASISGDSGK